MIALLGREFVNLPLLCGIAEHSHDASGPPTRGAFGSSLSFLAFPPSPWDDLLTVKAQLPSVFVPLFIPSWVSSHRSLRSRLCDPARCPLPLRSVWSTPGPSVRASRCRDPSSLRAPRGERSDPVSADGVLQEPCYLLAVLLHRTQDIFKTRYEMPILLNKFLFCSKNHC